MKEFTPGPGTYGMCGSQVVNISLFLAALSTGSRTKGFLAVKKKKKNLGLASHQ